MKKKETKKDEALKADESKIEEETPTSEESEEVFVDTADEVVETLDTAEEELPAETEEEEAEPEPTGEEEAEAPTEEEGRKTAKSRIRELVAEKKAAEQKAESLADQVRKFTSYRPEPITEIPQVQPDEQGSISAEELMRRQDVLVQIRLGQQENVHRVQQEALEATTAYPELDPDSESFDSELSESVSQATLAVIQSNPTASVKKFVDGMMKPYRRSLEKQEAGQTETITKQVSQQAMRPTQVQEQEKPFSELSIEEMEQQLGVVHR